MGTTSARQLHDFNDLSSATIQFLLTHTALKNGLCIVSRTATTIARARHKLTSNSGLDFTIPLLYGNLSIGGRATAGNRPAVGAFIELLPRSTPGTTPTEIIDPFLPRRPSILTTVNADGTFQFPNLPPGVYTVQPHLPEASPQILTVIMTDKSIDFFNIEAS